MSVYKNTKFKNLLINLIKISGEEKSTDVTKADITIEQTPVVEENKTTPELDIKRNEQKDAELQKVVDDCNKAKDQSLEEMKKHIDETAVLFKSIFGDEKIPTQWSDQLKEIAKEYLKKVKESKECADKLTEIKEQLDRSNATVEEKKAALNEAAKKITELKTASIGNAEEKTLLDQKITEQKKALETKEQEHKAALDALTANHDATLAEKTETITKLEGEKESMSEEHKQALDKLTKENEKNKKKIEHINQTLVAQEASIQANDGKSKEHTALLNNTNKELQKQIAELKNCNTEKKKLTLQNTTQSNQITALKLQNNTLQENLNALKEELKKAGIEMSEDDTVNMDNVQDHLSKAKLIHEHLQTINEFKDDQSTIDAKVGKLVKKYSDLKTKSDDQKTQIDKLEADLIAKDRSLAEQKTQLEQTVAKANDITAATTENKAALELLRAEIAEKVTENKTLIDKVTKLEATVVELKQKLEDNVKQNDSIETVKTELVDTKNTITKLTTCESEKKALEARVVDLESKMIQYEEIRKAMNTLENDMQVKNYQNYEEMKMKYETLLNGLKLLYTTMGIQQPASNIIEFLKKTKAFIQTSQATNLEQKTTITILKTKIKELEAQKTAQDAQIQELRNDEEKSSELAEIKEQQKKCTTELAELQQELAVLQTDNTAKESTIAELKAKLLKLNNELSELQNRNRSTGLGEDGEVMQKKQQITKVESELKAKLEAWRSNADTMIIKMDEILGEDTTVEKGAKIIMKNLLGEDEEILGGAGNEEKYGTDEEKMKALNGKIQLIHEKIKSTRAAFTTNVEKYDKLMEDEEKNKAKIEQLKTDMEAQTLGVATLQEVINKATLEIKQLEEANAHLTSQVTNLTSQIKALKENKTSMVDQQKRINELTADLKNQNTISDEERKKLEEELDKHQKELNETEKAYEAMKDKNRANSDANREMNNRITALTEKLRKEKPLLLSQMPETPNVRTPSVVQPPKITEPSAVFDVLKRQSEAKYESDDESDDDHKISTVKWNELNKEVTDLSDAITKLIEKNIADQNEHKEIIDKKELKYEENNKQIIDANTTTLQQLQTANATLQQDLKKLQHQLEQCRTNNTELEKKYKGDLEGLQNEIEKCETDNKTSLSERDTEIRRLQERLTAINSNMDSKDTDQAVVNSLNTALDEMKTQLDEEKQKYNQIRNQNTELNTQIAELNTRITQLNNSEVKQNNDEIERMKTELDTLKQQYENNLKEIIKEHNSKNLKYDTDNKTLREDMEKMKIDLRTAKKLLNQCASDNKQCQDELKRCNDDSKDEKDRHDAEDAKKHADLNAANMHVAAANAQSARDRAALAAYQAAQPNVVAAVDEIKRLKAQLASRKNNIQEADITYESFSETSPQEKRLRQMRIVIDELVLFRKNNNLKSIDAPHGSTIEGELLQYIINLRKDIPSTGYGTKAKHTFASSPRWYKLLMLKETNISDAEFRKARIKKNDAELNSDWSKQYS